MTARRLTEVLAMMMIGDAVVSLLFPRQHISLWNAGPPLWRAAMDELGRRPGLTRSLAVLELGSGLWLAAHQIRRGAVTS